MRITKRSAFRVLGILALFGASASAQQSIGIAPATVDATVKAGTSYTKRFTVSNGTTTALRFRLSVQDYWYDTANATITARAGTLPHSASQWVQFVPAETVIEPGGVAEINAIIAVPVGATGGYYTSPTFDAEPAVRDAGPNASSLTAKIALRFNGLMTLAVEGTSDYRVDVLAGRVVPPSAASELGIELTLRNSGSAHVRLRGQFAILDASGRLAGRGRADEKRVMPDQTLVHTLHWAADLAPGRYTAVVTLSYDRAGSTPASLVHEIPFEIPDTESAHATTTP